MCAGQQEGVGHQVEWQYEKDAAEDAVRHLTDVKGVSNLITVKPRISPAELKSKIEDALKRGAALDAQAEREEAERQAWAAPGVWNVENEIRVEP